MDARPYTVHIYEDEASRISKWTLQYPNTETGGDIFGLWLNENEVVIQAVLGPGANCRRTATSFFQDEQYLRRVGVLLTLSQGLCNVGSWHSHHTMNLPDPSRGDKDTIWRHLPTPGRFLLLIATIEMKTGARKVQMGFNLFESTSEGNKVIPMKLEILQGQSPIRANEAINRQMLEGAEVSADVHVKKHPEPPAQLDIPRQGINKTSRGESNAGYNVTADFFKGKKSGHQEGHRQPVQQNITCDGIRSQDTFLLPSHSQIRLPKLPDTPKYRDVPNSRQTRPIYHNDHLLGNCRDCFNVGVEYWSDGKIYVIPPPHREEKVGCCDIQ